MNDVPKRLLRDSLRDATTTPSPEGEPGCLDAETLAAWSDNVLGARERAAAETHAASCARCQMLLAAMARTAPPFAPRHWWRMPAVGWLVPLGAAAIAIVVWVNAPRAPLDRIVPLPIPAASGTAAAADSRANAAPDQPPDPGRGAARAESKDADRPTEQRRDTVTRPVPPAPRQREQTIAVPKDVRSLPATPNPSAPEIRREEAAAPAAPEPASPPAPAAATNQAAARAPAAAGGAALDEARSSGRGRLAAKAFAAPTVIASPNPDVRWRVQPGGPVERTIDAGRTWRTQPTSVTAALAAGAAPSPTICWLVGAAGSVIVTTDGVTWQQVPFPEAIDLTSVRASDGTHATVTAIDGRAFTTSDGGQTWRPA